MVLERMSCRVTCLTYARFRQKRFLRVHKEIDLDPHPVVVFVLHVGDTEKFPQALGFKSLHPSFSFQSQRAESMFHSHRGGWR